MFGALFKVKSTKQQVRETNEISSGPFLRILKVTKSKEIQFKTLLWLSYIEIQKNANFPEKQNKAFFIFISS